MIHGNGDSDLLARRGIGGIAQLGDSPAGRLSLKALALSLPRTLTSGRRLSWWGWEVVVTAQNSHRSSSHFHLICRPKPSKLFLGCFTSNGYPGKI